SPPLHLPPVISRCLADFHRYRHTLTLVLPNRVPPHPPPPHQLASREEGIRLGRGEHRCQLTPQLVGTAFGPDVTQQSLAHTAELSKLYTLTERVGLCLVHGPRPSAHVPPPFQVGPRSLTSPPMASTGVRAV